MKPKKVNIKDSRKKEKKKINLKPVIAFVLFIIAVAALYYIFVKLGIELGKMVNVSLSVIYNGELL